MPPTTHLLTHHRGCVTPKQLVNVANFTQGNYSKVEGYDELDLEWKNKFRHAVQQLHVDDEDWKWDPETNRLGKRRLTKKKPAAEPANEDGDGGIEPDAPAKPAKKRGRPKKDEGEDEAEKKPAKKAKQVSARSFLLNPHGANRV
jgi:hypothetical protein